MGQRFSVEQMGDELVCWFSHPNGNIYAGKIKAGLNDPGASHYLSVGVCATLNAIADQAGSSEPRTDVRADAPLFPEYTPGRSVCLVAPMPADWPPVPPGAMR